MTSTPQDHRETAEEHNETSLGSLEDLKTQYVNMYVQQQVPNYLPIMRLVADAERKFDQSLRKMKHKAWREGHKAAWQESGDGWNGEVNGIGEYEEILRRGCFQDNPYEREEDQ